MLFLKILYWAIFIIAIIAFFYFNDAQLAFFCLVSDLVFMQLPKE